VNGGKVAEERVIRRYVNFGGEIEG